MALRIRHRLGKFGLTIVVFALGTLIIGVAFALITVQITGSVASNEFATTTTTLPPTTTTTVPGDGLQAAITNNNEVSACRNAFNAGSTTLGAISFDLNSSAAQSFSPPKFLCVTNDFQGQQNEITTLTVQAAVVGSIENGCSADEATTDPDGSGCGTAGELETVVDVVLVPQEFVFGGVTSSFCAPLGPTGVNVSITLGGSAVSLKDPGDLNGGLAFETFCAWEVKLQLNGSATYDAKLGASTDVITLTLDVAGSGA